MTLLKVVEEDYNIFNGCHEIFRGLPQHSTESSVLDRMIVRYESAQSGQGPGHAIPVLGIELLRWICTSAEDTRELLGKMMPHLCGPSRPAASTVVVHSGIPNSSGAVAISRTASIAEIRQLSTLRWLSVSLWKRRAREVGRWCGVVVAVQTPVCGAWPILSRHATSESLSWLASGRRAMSLINRAGGRSSPGRFRARSPRGRWRSFCLFTAAALPFDSPPGVCLLVPHKNDKCRLLDGSKCSYFMVIAVLLAFIHKS